MILNCKLRCPPFPKIEYTILYLHFFALFFSEFGQKSYMR